jgi:O-antigen ligase
LIINKLLPNNINSKQISKIIYVIVCFVFAPVLGLMVIKLGLIAIPITIFLLFIFPFILKDPFNLFLWLIFSWPFLTIYMRFQVPKPFPDITYERILIPVLLGFILFERLATKRKLPKIGIMAGIYIVAQAISRLVVPITGGIGNQEIVYFLNIIILPITMYWITKALVISSQHLKNLLYVLILANLIICMSGFYELAVGGSISPFPVGVPSLGYERWLDVPGGRISGVIGNPAIFGGILGTGILASICCLVHEKRKSIQVVLGGMIVIFFVGVFLSYTRAAWISIAMVLFFVQFKIGNIWKKTLPFFLVCILLLVLVWGTLAGNFVIRKRILNPDNVNVRFDMAFVALDVFREKPFLGWGPGAYNSFIYEHVALNLSGSIGASSSHNTYLTMLVDGGLLVFLSFSGLIISFFIKANRAIRLTKTKSFERSTVWCMIGYILLFLLLGLSNDLRDFIYLNVLFWISAGTIDCLGEIYKSEAEKLSLERRPIG